MPRRLRVFVSSTVNDLPNERAAVIAKLREYNLESVNAEDTLPNGDGSWSVLSSEIRSSDVMVLILGSRYGWVPTTGPHASAGVSVTEIEYREAREAKIPIVPFMSNLAYGTDPTSGDAVARDRFRREVSDWDGGLYRQNFDLAADLAVKVGGSLISLLVGQFRKDSFVPPITPIDPVDVGTHVALAEFLRDRPTLFAGAGVSLAVGLPSAQLMMDAMHSAILEVDPSYRMPASGTAFNVLATDLEIARGRRAVEQLAVELVSPGASTELSEFHRLALASTDLVITTNYDSLFESSNDTRPIVISELGPSETLAQRALVKLHGSIDRPDSLVLSEADLFDFMT